MFAPSFGLSSHYHRDPGVPSFRQHLLRGPPFQYSDEQIPADDATADYADDTTYRRAGGPKRINRVRQELATVVEASVSSPLNSPWIATLRRASRGPGPTKWRDQSVAAYVQDAVGVDADAVRAGLGAQLLVVTDPMADIRRSDLEAANSERWFAPLSYFLFWHGQAGDDEPGRIVRAYRDDIRRFVISGLVHDSGIGFVLRHVRVARRFDGSVCTGGVIRDIQRQVPRDLNKAAQFASKASVLAAHMLNPTSGEGARIRERHSAWLERSMWGGPNPEHSRDLLAAIAQRRLVLDGGHDDIIALTARLREVAEAHSDPFGFDQATAIGSLDELRADSGAHGFVRPGDDARELRLQVADVAAGWARTIIAARGFHALFNSFGYVLYNGVPLSREAAEDIDINIAEHRRLVDTMSDD